MNPKHEYEIKTVIRQKTIQIENNASEKQCKLKKTTQTKKIQAQNDGNRKRR